MCGVGGATRSMLPQIGKLQTLLLIIQSGGSGGGGASFVRAFRRGPERFAEEHEAKLRTDVDLRGAIYSKKTTARQSRARAQ